MDHIDEAKDGFDPIQAFLWLKEDNGAVVVYWYGMELLTKPQQGHSKSMNKFKWRVLTIAIL